LARPRPARPTLRQTTRGSRQTSAPIGGRGAPVAGVPPSRYGHDVESSITREAAARHADGGTPERPAHSHQCRLYPVDFPRPRIYRARFHEATAAGGRLRVGRVDAGGGRPARGVALLDERPIRHRTDAPPAVASRAAALRSGAYRVFTRKRAFLVKSSETPSVRPSAMTSICGRPVDELQERPQELVAYILRGDQQVGAEKISSCQERHGANRCDG